MRKILVTGASGKLGKKTIEHLLQRRAAGDLIGLARDPAMAADLAARGVNVRKGDYSDYSSLVQAFQGVERLFLISTHAFTDRETQHANVIKAAREAGVKHVFYNPVIQRPGSGFDLMRVTEPDRFTVNLLKESGLDYTTAAQPPFLKSFEFMLGTDVLSTGVRVPAGSGTAAAASREDLAEAQAVLLTSDSHEGQSYDLTGSPAVSFSDLAKILTEVHGRQIQYVPVEDAKYLEIKTAAGLPQPVAEFALGWAHGVTTGEWALETGDLERLIGRKPTTTAEFYSRSSF